MKATLFIIFAFIAFYQIYQTSAYWTGCTGYGSIPGWAQGSVKYADSLNSIYFNNTIHNRTEVFQTLPVRGVFNPYNIQKKGFYVFDLKQNIWQGPKVIPPPLLHAYYKFNSETADHSALPNIDLNLVGTTAFAPSVTAGLGTALSVSGSGGAIGQNWVPIPTKSFSLSAWAYATSLTGAWNTIVKQWGDLSAGQFHLGLGSVGSDTLQDIVMGSTVVAPADFPTGSWNHVAAVIDDSLGEQRLYVNGVLVATSSYTYTAPSGSVATGLGVGVKANDSGSAVSATPEVGYWSGYLDEIAVYQGVLPDSQIIDIYNNGLAGIQLDGTSA